MAAIASHLNLALRSIARHFSPENPIRKSAASLWDWFLHATGSYVDLPFCEETIRLHSAFRSWNLDYESTAIRSFLARVRPGDTVWDIGANIGIYSVLAGKRVGAAGRVLSWEPHPDVFQTLRDHIRANDLGSRCRLIQAAVNDGTTGDVSFTLEPDPTTSRILLQPGTRLTRSVVVPAKSLDDWRQEVQHHPQVLKVDVEGAEALVLRGGRRLLSGEFGPRPHLLLAVHPQFLGEFGSTSLDIEQLCREMDYLAYDLRGSLQPPLEYSEYWLIPSELSEEFCRSDSRINAEARSSKAS